MHKPKWDGTVTAAENARTMLPVLVESYFDSGRKLIARKHNAEKLHRFRLKTKQFRYTLEMFREVYGPNLESRLELLRPVQSALGDINDCAATLDLLDARGSKTMEDSSISALRRRQRNSRSIGGIPSTHPAKKPPG